MGTAINIRSLCLIAGLAIVGLGFAVSVHADSPSVDPASLPDFPANLRHAAPVQSLNEAVVFTMNEDASPDYSLTLQRKVGSDALIRAWFKWDQCPPFGSETAEPAAAHKLGEVFGGGITCSALYDGENGITQAQLLDMATRGPDGNLVNAWDQPGIRHGSLSSPAYLDYLLHWCQVQIDAGADYLFMDENTAALSDREGYDDYSISDFRDYLQHYCPQTLGWSPTDPRWSQTYGIAWTDASECLDGRLDSFNYRAYLARNSYVQNPLSSSNKLAPLWLQFKDYRDDRAWKSLTDRIRAYARSRGRTVFLSGNGLVKYVDLQVLGFWDRWKVTDGHIDEGEDLIPVWRGLVTNGQDLAGKKVPVVFFHDWGMGSPPFPWMAVPSSERAVWMRTRGAEIYASGAFFAFPVHGPFGCDAGADGTLPLIAHLTQFYQKRRDLYLHDQWLGDLSVQCGDPDVSTSAVWIPATNTVAVHVINRDVQAGVLIDHGPVKLMLPVSAPLRAEIISPDFDGVKTAAVSADGGDVDVELPSLEAYSVVLLRYARKPDLSRITDPLREYPTALWVRPDRSEFIVNPDGSVQGSSELNGFIQGNLHTDLRNNPTFILTAGPHAQLLVHVTSVAAPVGARLQIRIDGVPAGSVNLSDLDHVSDPSAKEYDQTLTVPIPPGHHRVMVDNVGWDWVVVDWYQFEGVK